MRSTILSGLAGLVVGAFVGITLLAPLIGYKGGPGFSAGGGAGKFFTVGTGGVTGVYYPAGGAICLLVNKDRKNHGIRCSVESTAGSVVNLEKIRAGSLELGIVQSDWQYHAFKGSSRFKDQKPFNELRSVFSLHSEPFTVVARADAGIRTFQDLIGKRVNIGNPGSGQRATMEVVMKAFGWSMNDFYAATELESRDQSSALCDGVIDAMVFTVGHPSKSIKEATTSCDSLVVDVTGPAIDRLVGENDYYRHASIPAGMYRGNTKDVLTFGVNATVVAAASLPDEVVYTTVKAVFSNFETFKDLHPAFKGLKKSEMIKEGLSVPLHPGAVKYYREAGLM